MSPALSCQARTSTASRLDRDGIDKNFIHAGDTVHIWGAPNKDPTDNRIHLKRIERRADGWKWGQGRGETR